MIISKLLIKNFRCFASKSFTFNNTIVIIQGSNGSGKSSLFEALYYLCYLKSPRTLNVKELLHFNTETFSLSLEGKKKIHDDRENHNENWMIHVGVSLEQKRIKINDKKISSYKQLFDYYKVLLLTQEDLMIIKGLPELRRSFIDQAIFLIDPHYISLIKNYRKILKQRNALLENQFPDPTMYEIWTEQFRAHSHSIQKKRYEFIARLETIVNQLIEKFFPHISKIEIIYTAKTETPSLLQKEFLAHRSLFGAHLDDFQLIYHNQQSKHYASRGQQKLLILLIKAAQIELLNSPAILCVDDFITDFDEQTIVVCLKFLTYVTRKSQIFVSCPILPASLKNNLINYDHQIITLE